MSSQRLISQRYAARPAMDGDGVNILRTANNALDPFLMLDELHSEQALVNGFPPHPHRGIETLTYMRAGGFEHRDHMGNREVIGPNSAQWMSAGRGVIHSEMPVATEAGLHGFQMWINLPAAQKLQPPSYQQADDIPSIQFSGGTATAIAGSWNVGDQSLTSELQQLSASARVLCVELNAQGSVDITVDQQETVLLYVFDGELTSPALAKHIVAATTAGSVLSLQAGASGAKLLVLAGMPIGEPIAQYGPFVMNTREEIDQALADYRNGTLAQ